MIDRGAIRLIVSLRSDPREKKSDHSKFVLPAGGLRDYQSSAVRNQGTNAYYWASTPNSSTNGHNLNFNSTNTNPVNTAQYSYGFTVRCVRRICRPVPMPL